MHRHTRKDTQITQNTLANTLTHTYTHKPTQNTHTHEHSVLPNSYAHFTFLNSNHHNLQTITLRIAPPFELLYLLWFKRNLWRTVQHQQSSIWDGMGPPTAQSYREVSLLWRRPQKISMEGKEVSTDYDDELGKVTRTTMLNLSFQFFEGGIFFRVSWK